MFIGHLPAGYLLSKTIWQQSPRLRNEVNWKWFAAAGLLGSILPDLDLFYFYWIDQRQHNHHTYWTHIPLFWFVLCSITIALLLLVRRRQWMPYALIFYANIFFHLALDTIVGGIMWLAPFSGKLLTLSVVQRSETPWWMSFVWHWSFLLELLTVYAAALVFARASRHDAPIQGESVAETVNPGIKSQTSAVAVHAD